MTSITLDAESLYSKWGFCDGDILNDAFFDMHLSRFADQHETLCLLVEEKLLPLLPVPVKTWHIGCIHNPIRVDDDHLKDGSKQANAGISVDVTYEEIMQYAKKVGAA